MNLKANHPYLPQTQMLRLVADDYRLLEVLSRFGIRLGFDSKSVDEVCRESGVDTATFLTVVNFVKRGYTVQSAPADIDLRTLLQYLRHSHIYFLDYSIPAIRRKLLDGIHLHTSDVSFLIMKFFDEYTGEVARHMEYEESTVFEYVRQLLAGRFDEDYKVSTYSRHHEEVSSKLKELKNLILRFCPADADANLLNAALYDIYRFEDELSSHCLVEDLIFVPAVTLLETKIKSGNHE